MAGKAVERFLQRLAERGVGVDVAGELGHREVPSLREREFGQELRYVRTDHVAT